MAHPMTVTIGVQSFAVFAAERERERKGNKRDRKKKLGEAAWTERVYMLRH